ncbi:hypothetical protein [Collimonas arenae]|uniref:hypothetical protein n=1 Tax=Collimonas arenae TaxID=279058 RepID=UPI0005719EA9|nr:hypothetical protein [Collimonas arenae]
MANDWLLFYRIAMMATSLLLFAAVCSKLIREKYAMHEKVVFEFLLVLLVLLVFLTPFADKVVTA